MLRYRSMFDLKVKERNRNREMARLQEIRDLFFKLYAKTSCGYSDTSRWPIALTESLCSESFKHHVIVNRTCSSTDHLFKSEVATKAYLKFIKFGGFIWNGNSVSSFIRFGAIITDAVDSSALKLGLYRNANNVLEHFCALDSLSLHSVKGSRNRGGATPQESSRRMRSQLAACAANILFHRYSLFCAYSPLSHIDRDLKPLFSKKDDESKAKQKSRGTHAMFPNASNRTVFHCAVHALF